eukprot:1188490-Prorocentrum_minimum.AAC.6
MRSGRGRRMRTPEVDRRAVLTCVAVVEISRPMEWLAPHFASKATSYPRLNQTIGGRIELSGIRAAS